MVDAFFRVSVIDGALNLSRHLQAYPGLSVADAARQLRTGPAVLAGYDYRRAIELIDLTGWDAIVADGERQEQLQETLKRMALRLKPFWVRIAYLGRSRVLQVLSEDQLQCLEFAGLLTSPPSTAVMTWWDELSFYSRRENERRKIEVGREGERRTMAYESRRLRKEGISRGPIWIALEDSCAGYDVLSFQHADDGKLDDLRIEVKAASFSPTRFFLSRLEWDTASKQPHLHIFHIWNLATANLLKLAVSDIALHMPIDSGAGEWREVRIELT